MDVILGLLTMFLRDIVFNTVGLISFMGLLLMVLYRDGYKFFFVWFGICVLVFYFLDRAAGLWGFILYMLALPGVQSSGSSGRFSGFGDNDDYCSDYTNAGNSSGYSGSTYHPGGDIDYLPNGNSSVRYGDVSYMSSGIRSVKEGSVTYYFDDQTGRRLGRSVDNANGVHDYFDNDNRYLGHSYRSGDVTSFFGDCFECR